jgi:hypothetical protein
LGEGAWLEAVGALGDVLDAMEAKLDAIEKSLTVPTARDEASTYAETEAHHHRRIAA